MLSDKDCEELAEIFISFVEQCPENLLNRNIKARIGASHSLITAGVMDGRDEWENTLGRVRFTVRP